MERPEAGPRRAALATKAAPENTEAVVHGAVTPVTALGTRKAWTRLALRCAVPLGAEAPGVDTPGQGSAEEAVFPEADVVALVMGRPEMGLEVHGRPRAPEPTAHGPRRAPRIARPGSVHPGSHRMKSRHTKRSCSG